MRCHAVLFCSSRISRVAGMHHLGRLRSAASAIARVSFAIHVMMRSVFFRYHTVYLFIGLARAEVSIPISLRTTCANVRALRIITVRDAADLASTARQAP